jgi:hypothetical protein
MHDHEDSGGEVIGQRPNELAQSFYATSGPADSNNLRHQALPAPQRA